MKEKIVVTPDMIKAGTKEFCGYDERFGIPEAAVFKIFRQMILAHSEVELEVVLDPEMEAYFRPYLMD